MGVCLSCNWCWRCRSVKSIWCSSNQFWTQSKQFQTLSGLENGSDSKCTKLTKNSKPYPVWKIGQIPSAPHSQTIPKSYPVWRIGQIPSVPHSQTIPNPIQFGDMVRFQVGHTGRQIPVWETGWDSKYTTLTINAIWPIKYGHRTWKYKHGYHIFEKVLIVCLEMWNACEGGFVICNSSSSSIIHKVRFRKGWTYGVIVWWSIDPTTQNWSETGHGP